MTQSPAFDYLSIGDLYEIAAGVLPSVAVRDAGLSESAAARPRTTVLGDDAYPTLSDKAAALMHSIARNHALVDGNERLAWTAMRVFCLLNGHDISYPIDEAEQLVLDIATGDLDVAAIAASIAAHLRSVPLADMP